VLQNDFEEAAAVQGIGARTAKEWWASARAWPAVELRDPPSR